MYSDVCAAEDAQRVKRPEPVPDHNHGNLCCFAQLRTYSKNQKKNKRTV